MWNLSKVQKQLAALGLFAIAVIWGLAFWVEGVDEAQSDRLGKEKMAMQAEMLYRVGSANIKRLNEMLLDFRSAYQFDGDLDAFASQVSRRSKTISDLSFQVALIDKDGMMLFSNLARASEKVDLSQREHFKIHASNPAADKLFISKMLIGKVSKKPTVQFTRPLRGKTGEFAGVIVLSASPEIFTDLGKEMSGSPDFVAVAARFEDKGIISRYPPDPKSYGVALKDSDFAKAGAPLSGTYARLSPIDGKDRLVGYRIDDENGIVYIAGERRSLLSAGHALFEAFAYGAAAASSLLLAMGFYFMGRSQNLESQNQRLLLARKESAERQSRAKSELMVLLSHELKTPLNGIMGMANLASELDDPEEIKECIGHLTKSAKRLHELQTDIMDYAKLDAGLLTSSKGHVVIEDLIQAVEARCAGSFDGFSGLSWRLGEGIDGLAWLDQDLCRKVLWEFCDNAFKHAPGSPMRIEVQRRGDAVRFEVSDKGPGVDEKRIAFIFEPFKQGQEVSTREAEGAGLGLAIAKKACEAMGAAIGVDKGVDGGSVFWMELPDALSSNDAPKKGPAV